MSASTHKKIGRFFKHSTIYTIGNILNRVGAFILLPIYTNYLTVAEYGVLELFYAVAAVVSGILAVGIAHAALRFYFEYDKEEDRHAVISTNYIASAVISIIGVGIVLIWHQELAELVFKNSNYNRSMVIILITLILELSSQVCIAYIRAIEYSIFFVIIALAKLLVQVALNTYLLVVHNAGVEGVLFGNLVTVALGWLILSVFTLSKCGIRFRWNIMVPVLKYSFPFLLSMLTGIVIVNVDRFAISTSLNLHMLGIYALAMKFGNLLIELIGEPFNRSYGAFRFTIMNDPEAPVIQAKIVRYLVILTFSAGLGITYFTSDLLQIMSDPSFWPASKYLPLILLAAAFKVISYPLQTGILYKKKTRYIFYIGLAEAITITIGSIALVQLFGILGVCIALFVTSLVQLILTDQISQKMFKVKYEYRKIFPIILYTLIFYILMLQINDMSLIWDIVAKAVLYIIYIALLIKSSALDKEELDFVKEFVNIKILRRST